LFIKSTENSELYFEQISVLKSVSGLKFVGEIGAWIYITCTLIIQSILVYIGITLSVHMSCKCTSP